MAVSLADYDPPDFFIVLQRAREGLVRLRHREPELRRAAARDVLPHYGANYSHRGLMDEIALSGQIRLTAITFYPDGSGQLDYGAGDLFDGRLISMWVAPDGTPSEADIGD